MGVQRNKVKFIFLLPYAPEHYDYYPQCTYAIIKQDYPDNLIEIMGYKDIDRKGQVHHLNLMLDDIFERKENLNRTYINFHGVDDYLLPDTLKYIESTIKRNNYPAWLYGSHAQKFDGKLLWKESQKWNYKKLLKKNYIAGGAVFVRADMYLNRRFRDLMFKQGADWDMWLRLGEKEAPIVTNDYYYVERIGTSVIRPASGLIKTKIFNRIKYPIWRIERWLRDLI